MVVLLSKDSNNLINLLSQVVKTFMELSNKMQFCAAICPISIVLRFLWIKADSYTNNRF